MKKILFAAGITLLAGFSAVFAQEVKQNQSAPAAAKQSRTQDNGAIKADPEAMAQRRTERLNKELTFTADQQQKVHDLFLKEAQQDKGRSVQRKETDEQLKAILTPEQNQKYETLKQNRQQMMMERRQSRSELKASPSTPQETK